MKYSLPSIALALSTFTSTAFAGGDMTSTPSATTLSGSPLASTVITNPTGTPSWIGIYKKADTMTTSSSRSSSITAPLSSALSSCPEAEGDAGKLVSLQMVGVCKAVKVPTRFRR